MIIYKGFKYRLKPTPEQKRQLLQQAGNARFLWNYLLYENIKNYEETKKFHFTNAMVVSIPKLKKEYEFLNLSFSQSLQTVARQLGGALTNFFKSRKEGKNIGFPKFKKKSKVRDSFHCPQKWVLNKNSVRIPKIGEVKWIKHRKLQGKPKSVTITQDGNQWFCSVLCEIEVEDRIKKQENIIGIDLGLKSFAVCSDGNIVKNEKHLKKHEDKLRREQRKLSRKAKGSENREKQKVRLQNFHRKVRNVRKDFLNKITHYMITKYDGFCLENLNVKGMMKNSKLSKSIADASWGEFARILKYKSEWNFKHYIEINRWFGSTKTCSVCGNIQEMKLSNRTFECEKCGVVIDRDLNASLNIRFEGLNTLGHRGINVCGDDKIHVCFPKENKQVVVDEAEKRIYG